MQVLFIHSELGIIICKSCKDVDKDATKLYFNRQLKHEFNGDQ